MGNGKGHSLGSGAAGLDLGRRPANTAEDIEVIQLRGIAAIDLGLAVLAHEQGDFTAAETLALRSRDIYLTNYYERGHWRVAEAESVLGGALLGDGDLAAAQPLIEGALSVLRRTRGDAARPTVEADRRFDALGSMSE